MNNAGASDENFFVEKRKSFIEAKDNRNKAYSLYASMLHTMMQLMPILGCPHIGDAARAEYEGIGDWMKNARPLRNYPFSPALMTDTYEELAPMREALIKTDNEFYPASQEFAMYIRYMIGLPN